MATITKYIAETNGQRSTWTIEMSGSNITADGSTFTLNVPTIRGKYSAYSGKTVAQAMVIGDVYVGDYRVPGYNTPNNAAWQGSGYYTGDTWFSFESNFVPYSGSTAKSVTINTSSIFTSSNKTSRTLNITAQKVAYSLASGNSTGSIWGYVDGRTRSENWGTIATITLNVPPTFTYGSIEYDKPFIYAGVTTASVDVSNLTAYYEGYIVEAKLTIGSESVVLTGDETDILSSGTLSILLNQAGTFTPSITVTDSRGQTKTETLPEITVKPYINPALTLEVQRCKTNGVPDEETTVAMLISCTINYFYDVAKLMRPIVKLDDVDVSNQITWYQSWDITSGVSSRIDNFGDYHPTSPVTIYGLLTGDFSIASSYNVGVIITDSLGVNSQEIDQMLPQAFFTVDFLAGGHGIAFGILATKENTFECDLEAQFNKGITGKVDTYTYTDFRYNTGFTYYSTSDGNTPAASKFGRIVNIVGAIKTTSAQSSTGQKIMGYVPSGCEPLYEQHFLQQGSGVSRYQLVIRPDGAIIADRYGITSDTAIPNGVWLNISATYISKQ